MGLSAAVFTDLGIALFAGDPAIFLLMFAIAPAVFIGGEFVRGLESFAAFHARMPPLPASSCCVRRAGETLAHLSATITRSSQAGTCISHHDGGTFWMPPDRRRGFPLSVPAPPSLPLSSTPLLVEASPEGVAQMERDALG